LGKGVPINRRQVLGPVKRDIEPPAATEKTTVLRLSKILTEDSIRLLFGLIDAPLGAKPVHFGVEWDKNGR